jgi:hypothetical protein
VASQPKENKDLFKVANDLLDGALGAYEKVYGSDKYPSHWVLHLELDDLHVTYDNHADV